jgi:hypothetical protein
MRLIGTAVGCAMKRAIYPKRHAKRIEWFPKSAKKGILNLGEF